MPGTVDPGSSTARCLPADRVASDAIKADIVSSYGAHANAYITKPIDLDEFDRAVAQIRNFYGHTATLPRQPGDTTRHDGPADDPANSTPPA